VTDAPAVSAQSISALAVPARAEVAAPVRELMDAVEADLGFVPNMVRAFALNGESLLAFFAYFSGLLDPERGRLPVRDREFLAVVVSAENRCNYCIATHASILRELTGDAPFVERLVVNHRHAGLSARDRALANFAVALTRDPAGATPELLEPLRGHGLDDAALLEAVEVVAAFNYSNRLANAIALQPDPQFVAAHRDYGA